ncbi:MAG: hypothetical protein HY821_00550 [Acidobacteria bacterium]|nr:hypothetical protein [Acidobacteriota bacterium]
MPESPVSDISRLGEERAISDSGQRKALEKLHASEIGFLLAVLLLWTSLLAVGMFVASQPYRDVLVQGQRPLSEYVFSWVMAFASYTFTNVAILSILSALAGAGARHVEAQLGGNERITNVRALYASAMLRGFFVYLIALSGLMFLAESVFTTIAKSPDVYIRLSGSISLLSFMLGFNPEMFARMLDRIARVLEDQGSKTR